MAKEIVSVLKVNTADSEKTIKGLREEIKSLKTQLESAEIGSEQFTEASKALAEAQNELKTAMTATKATVENADGSYNALVQTMSELKKEWRATADEVKRNELGQQIDNINTQLKELDASIGNTQRNVGNYKADFVDAMTEMQTGAFDFGKEMGDMNKKTEVTRTALDGVGQVASGLASGFAAVQGVTALMGIENKNLEKTLVKVQAAMAIAQGIGGMKGLVEGAGKLITAFKAAQMGSEAMATQTNATTVAMGTTATATNVATGALHTFKTAVISTGVGALVVALGTLIAYFVTLEDEADETADSINKLNQEMDYLKIAVDKVAFSNSERALQNYKQAVIDAKGDVNKLKQAQKEYNDELAKSEKRQLLAAQALWQDKLTKAETEKKNWKSEDGDEVWNNAEENRKKAEQELQAINQRLLKIEEDTQNKIVEKAIQSNEKAVEAANKKKEEITEIHNRLLNSIMSDQEVELNNLKITYEKEKELLKGRNQDLLLLENEYQNEVNKINAKYAEERKAKQEKLNQELKDELTNKISGIDTKQGYKEQETEVKYDAKETDHPVQAIQNEIDKLGELREVRLEAHNERLKQIDELLKNELFTGKMRMELENEKSNLIRENAIEEQRFIIENSKLQKDRINEEKKLKQQQVTATISTTKSMLSAVSDLMKDGSKEQKGVASAIATMDALQAANGAYAAMASIPVVGPALGIAAAAAALAAGYANVKAIWAVDESGSNTPSLSTASVTPTFNAEQAMPVEYTRNVMTDSEMETINQPTKVYVLESDITDAQKTVEVRESNATF